LRTSTRLTIAGTLLLSLLAGATPAAAEPSPSDDISPFIVGGHEATEPYPAMASLQMDHRGDPNWHICGAVLVSRRYVAVNAHCVTNFPDGSAKAPETFHLRIGSHDRTSGGVVVGVTKVLPHAEWDWAAGTDRVADIALLRLDTDVQLQHIEIAPRLRRAAVTRLLGWGVTEPSGEGPLPLILQELDTRVVRPERCAAAGITAWEICVGNPNGTDGACFGDSGGPALQRITRNRWQVVGGASRETTAFCGTGAAVYTDLTYWRDWIYQVMRTGTVPPRTSATDGTTPPAPIRSYHWADGV